MIASICKDSLYEFIKEFWHVIIPEKPIWNWHIEYICDEVQEVLERIFRGEKKLYDLLINIPPGETKSTVVSVMVTPWAWTRMPSFRNITATHGYDLGLDLSRKCRDVILSDKYQSFFHGIELREDQNTKGYFVNNFGGGRLSATVGSSRIGFHAHFHAVDDAMNPKKARSESEKDLKEANRWITEDLSGRKVDKEVTAMVMVMQRLHQMDPTGYLLKKYPLYSEEYGPDGNGESPPEDQNDFTRIKHIKLPADLEDGIEPVPLELKEQYENGLLNPQRLSKDVLAALRQLGEYTFAAQYSQNPVPASGGMFKVDRLKIIKAVPKDVKLRRVMRYWDKAYTEGAGAYTVGVKMGIGSDKGVYVLHVERGQYSVDERERVIKLFANADGRGVRVGQEQEGGSGKQSSEMTVKNLQGFSVLSDRPQGKGSKVTRAEPFAAQVNIGNVYLLEGEWNQTYIDELKHFPFSTYKDQVDGSSGAYNALNKMPATIEEWAEVAF